jgi:hypothetical protein
MRNRDLFKLGSKFLTLAILAGCLGFLSSDYIPVALASTCDSNFSYDVIACLDGWPPREGAPTPSCDDTYPGEYQCCYNTYVNTYDLCVLQNGPIGATMLQPVSQPAADPNAEQPSLVELKVRSCRMFGTGHNTRYNTCMANGGSNDFCCMYAWTL